MRMWFVAMACGLLWTAGSFAQQSENMGTPPDIVVNGSVPRCVARPGDPLDAITSSAPRGSWVQIAPDQRGNGYRYLAIQESSPTPDAAIGRLGEWRRAGNGLPDYIFRQPVDGTPVCLGKKRPLSMRDDEDWGDDVVVVRKRDRSAAQLQQLIDVAPYQCRTVRLTLNVATRGAMGSLWMNGGHGEWARYPLNGSHGWTTVRFQQGPVGWWYTWTGFGLFIERGDAWLDQIRFEVVNESELSGKERSEQATCRAHMSGSQHAAQERADQVASRRGPALSSSNLLGPMSKGSTPN